MINLSKFIFFAGLAGVYCNTLHAMDRGIYDLSQYDLSHEEYDEVWEISDSFPYHPFWQEFAGNFSVEAEVLYWQPRAAGLELNFGTTSIAIFCTDDDEQLIFMEELDLDPAFEWNAGSRISVGYQSPFNWEASLSWTNFYGQGSRRDSTETSAINHGKYQVGLNQIDLCLASNFESYSIEIKPFLGIRGIEIRQNLDATLITNIVSNDGNSTETRHFHDQQRNYNIGPILGLQASRHISHGFGLYGAAAGSVLFGSYTITFDDSDIFTDPKKSIFSTNKRHLYAFNNMFDLQIGIYWDAYIFNSSRLTMKLGFEHHQYLNQNYFSTRSDDLSFDGAVFSLGVAF